MRQELHEHPRDARTDGRRRGRENDAGALGVIILTFCGALQGPSSECGARRAAASLKKSRTRKKRLKEKTEGDYESIMQVVPTTVGRATTR
jgi:hypothetical protein